MSFYVSSFYCTSCPCSDILIFYKLLDVQCFQHYPFFYLPSNCLCVCVCMHVQVHSSVYAWCLWVAGCMYHTPLYTAEIRSGHLAYNVNMYNEFSSFYSLDVVGSDTWYLIKTTKHLSSIISRFKQNKAKMYCLLLESTVSGPGLSHYSCKKPVHYCWFVAQYHLALYHLWPLSTCLKHTFHSKFNEEVHIYIYHLRLCKNTHKHKRG